MIISTVVATQASAGGDPSGSSSIDHMSAPLGQPSGPETASGASRLEVPRAAVGTDRPARRSRTRSPRAPLHAELRAAAGPVSRARRAAPAGPVATQRPPRANWIAIAACESGGHWSLNSGNGFWGGLQFMPSTWFAFGGGRFDGTGRFPYSEQAQIQVAQRVLAAEGPGAWPVCFRWA